MCSLGTRHVLLVDSPVNSVVESVVNSVVESIVNSIVESVVNSVVESFALATLKLRPDGWWLPRIESFYGTSCFNRKVSSH